MTTVLRGAGQAMAAALRCRRDAMAVLASVYEMKLRSSVTGDARPSTANVEVSQSKVNAVLNGDP